MCPNQNPKLPRYRSHTSSDRYTVLQRYASLYRQVDLTQHCRKIIYTVYMLRLRYLPLAVLSRTYHMSKTNRIVLRHCWYLFSLGCRAPNITEGIPDLTGICHKSAWSGECFKVVQVIITLMENKMLSCVFAISYALLPHGLTDPFARS